MRIAQVAPLFESVPPQLYGGTERIVSYLTEELVRRGHDVTLFASGDSVTSATLVPIVERAARYTAARRDIVGADLIRELGIIGTLPEVRERLRALEDLGVTHVGAAAPPDPTSPDAWRSHLTSLRD